VSGIRAASILVENGYIEECGSILRTVSDFTYEILSISDAMATGNWAKEQLKFVEQYFAELSQTPEEYANAKRERWVTRDELLKAHYKRFAESGNGEPEHVRRVLRFLSYGYDKFVHGAYITAMELYDGDAQRFMLSGCTYPEKIDEFKFSLASKFHEAPNFADNFAMKWRSRGRGFKSLLLHIQSLSFRTSGRIARNPRPCARFAIKRGPGERLCRAKSPESGRTYPGAICLDPRIIAIHSPRIRLGMKRPRATGRPRWNDSRG
jgi:hypothetical protein